MAGISRHHRPTSAEYAVTVLRFRQGAHQEPAIAVRTLCIFAHNNGAWRDMWSLNQFTA